MANEIVDPSTGLILLSDASNRAAASVRSVNDELKRLASAADPAAMQRYMAAADPITLQRLAQAASQAGASLNNVDPQPDRMKQASDAFSTASKGLGVLAKAAEATGHNAQGLKTLAEVAEGASVAVEVLSVAMKGFGGPAGILIAAVAGLAAFALGAKNAEASTADFSKRLNELQGNIEQNRLDELTKEYEENGKKVKELGEDVRDGLNAVFFKTDISGVSKAHNEAIALQEQLRKEISKTKEYVDAGIKDRSAYEAEQERTKQQIEAEKERAALKAAAAQQERARVADEANRKFQSLQQGYLSEKELLEQALKDKLKTIDDADRLTGASDSAIKAARLNAQNEFNEKLKALDEAPMRAAQEKFEQLQQSLQTEEEAIDQSYKNRLAIIEEASKTNAADPEAVAKAKSTIEQQYLDEKAARQEQERIAELEHQAALGDIEAQGQLKRLEFEKMTNQQRVKTGINMLMDLTSGAAKNNRVMFEINKVAATANAIVKGHEAVQSAYAFGSSWGGPAGGAAMAAIAIAATAAQIQAIQSTSFGSGGGGGGGAKAGGAAAPSSTPTAGPPDTSSPTSSTQTQSSGSSMNVTFNVQGGLVDERAARESLEKLMVTAKDMGMTLALSG